MAAQAGEFDPCLSAVGRAEQRGVFDSGIDRLWLSERRFQMPDALELPGVRCAVIPLVRTRHAIVYELVIHWRPGLAAVVGALDQLAEPAARLGCVQPIRIGRRSLDMVNLPAGEVGSADVPFLALFV